MSRRIFNVVRPREYTTANGDTRTTWDRHGVMIVDGAKVSLHLDSIPTGEWDGWFNVFERQEDAGGSGGGHTNGQRGRQRRLRQFDARLGCIAGLYPQG